MIIFYLIPILLLFNASVMRDWDWLSFFAFLMYIILFESVFYHVLWFWKGSLFSLKTAILTVYNLLKLGFNFILKSIVYLFKIIIWLPMAVINFTSFIRTCTIKDIKGFWRFILELFIGIIKFILIGAVILIIVISMISNESCMDRTGWDYDECGWINRQ